MKKKIKNRKGFTLLELLVVVLIIGVLAAIALPQYKMAIGKSKFNTLKTITKNLVESVQRYYLANGVYPTKHTDLDITFDEMEKTYTDSGEFDFYISDGTVCAVMFKNKRIDCSKEIFGSNIRYSVNIDTNKPTYCFAYSKDTSDLPNRLCRKETGKKRGDCNYTAYCVYTY